ncbi:hypothetical protein [Rubrivirga sp.]|uniref:hypothetical protein n=1 Tax=Rubrivirga sp. TaxID=1885344 RepID=UPI003C7152B1
MGPLAWTLLLAAVAAIAFVLFRRLSRQSGTAARPGGPSRLKEPYRDELTSLGLSSVRAASPVATPARPKATPSEAVPSESTAASSLADPSPTSDMEGPLAGTAIPALLRALATHARRPAALVRHDGSRFDVLCRTDDGPLATIAGSALDLEEPSTANAATLGGLSVLVGGRARAIPAGDHVVLVGLSAGLDEPVLDRFGRLIADLLPEADVEVAALEDGPAVEETNTADAPVPRAVIIGQEQDAAEADDRPLAFALVTLADAEEILTTQPPEVAAKATAALLDRLETADHVRRVEPFGDLLFGTFIDADADGAAAWCQTLSASDPPLFIGAVAPADGEPQAVRAAATSALRDAYDQQQARVVESK